MQNNCACSMFIPLSFQEYIDHKCRACNKKFTRRVAVLLWRFHSLPQPFVYLFALCISIFHTVFVFFHRFFHISTTLRFFLHFVHWFSAFFSLFCWRYALFPLLLMKKVHVILFMLYFIPVSRDKNLFEFLMHLFSGLFPEFLQLNCHRSFIATFKMTLNFKVIKFYYEIINRFDIERKISSKNKKKISSDKCNLVTALESKINQNYLNIEISVEIL